ncbi:DUF927 domain-containing protein [Eubacteriales bacterium OttesenSCG-928-N13]|nr:DUF927 domain-containing protein [Eubacteriales bacterium OttesenSCG-928-N13]
MAEHQNLDTLIQWPDFYRKYVGQMNPSGQDKLSGCCPFGTHQDKHPSFWITTTNGMFKCEACGEAGNATTFLSKMERITTGEAYKRLCELAGVDQERPARKTPSYTVKEYALEKRLPQHFLQTLGVRAGAGNRYVEIPYKDEHGRVTAIRKRMPPGAKQRFLWNKGAKPTLYGLWRLQEARDAGHVVLVEGESDAQTLWFLGIPALGMPGASTFSAVYAKQLMGIGTIYLHIENDRGGRTAKRKVAEALLEAGYTGTVKVWSCAVHHALKDPSAIFCADERRAAEIMISIMREAPPLNLEMAVIDLPPGLEDAPIQLRTPPGYEIDATGIYKIDAKTGVLEQSPFCWTPVLIASTLTNEDGSTKLELSFLRDGRWRSARMARDHLMVSRHVVKLAGVGADATSENASELVRWFSALECANADLIPKRLSVTHYGWIGEGHKHFMPYSAGEFVFDTDGYAALAHVGKTVGSFESWRDAMQPNRERTLFRFIFASAFAAPLLSILGQRIFLVYNWGDSGGGKTAVLMAGLSAWGNPDDLRMSFNATNVAIERMVQFYSDMPFGLNERQLAGSRQEFLDKLVYTLSEGKARGRGAREGGLQHQGSWRSVIIANGEEPLAGDTSQSGVQTRALELFGQPFEREEDAAAIYDVVAQHHGHAGRMFIEQLVKADHENLRSVHRRSCEELAKCSAKTRNHVSAVACVCVADYLVSQWLFDSKADQAHTDALRMGQDILSSLEPPEEMDVNQRAYEFIVGWVDSNLKQFSDDYTGGTQYGFYAPSDRKVYIYPNVLNDALEKRGFSPRKVRKWLADNGLITTSHSHKKILFSVQKWHQEHNVRVVELLLPDAAEVGWDSESGDDFPFD